MTPSENVQLIRSTLDAFNAADFDACTARLSPSFVIHLAELPEPLHGPDVWRAGAEMLRRAFPDLSAQIDDVLADGDRVALRLTLSGTHRGDFQGIAATGRKIRYISHEFYRVEDGLFAEEWICSDTATLMHQLA